MSRILVALLACVGMLLTSVTVSSAQDLNCDDFASQEEAQLYLNADPSDPSQLDADDDGWACEVFFGYTGSIAPGQTQDQEQDDEVSVDQLPNTGAGVQANGFGFASLAFLLLAFAIAGCSVAARARSFR